MSGVATAGLSSAQADQILQAVRNQLQLVLTSPTHVQPGQPVAASLVPTAPEIDASELVNGVLNLGWAAKDVLFADANPVDVPTQGDLDGDELTKTKVAINRGQPFPSPIPGGTTLAGTPGVLNQLFGTFAVPQLKVGLRVRWIVKDQSGNELKEEEQDFIATQGLANPTVSLLFPPPFRELRLDTLANPLDGGAVRCLSAEVTLSLGTRTLVFPLGPVPVLLLPLLIPTVVVLFTESNFDLSHDSAVLIFVPRHSPFASAEPLFKTLRKIEGIVSALRGIGGLASFLLGLDELLETVPEQPRIRFVSGFAAESDDTPPPANKNGIPRLKNIRIKRRPWYQFLGSDPNFDDRVRSLLVFGLPGTKVQFFNDIRFKSGTATNQGNFDVQLRNELQKVPPELDFFVSIRTLDTKDDEEPVTFPANRVSRLQRDTKGGDQLWHTDMSSIRFHPDWLASVDAEIASPPDPPELRCPRRTVPIP